MRFEFPAGEYFELEVASPGTAGIAFDCQLRVGFCCRGLTGQVAAWCDGPDVQAFVAELGVLGRELEGSAALMADDGHALNIRLSPVDSLGHFVLEVQVGANRTVQDRFLQLSCNGAFQLDSSELSSFCIAVESEIVSGVNT